MGNMGYCRFENTLSDLQDCYDHMDEKLGPEEATARLSIIKLCDEIHYNYGEEEEE